MHCCFLATILMMVSSLLVLLSIELYRQVRYVNRKYDELLGRYTGDSWH